MHCLYGGYNLHRFSDALGLVSYLFLKLYDPVLEHLSRVYSHNKFSCLSTEHSHAGSDVALEVVKVLQFVI